MGNNIEIMVLTESEYKQKTIFSPHAKNSDELIMLFANALVDAVIENTEKGEDK